MQPLLNEATVWLWTHLGVPLGGNPYLIAAAVAVAAYALIRIGRRFAVWAWTAAVTFAAVAVITHLLGLGA